MKKTILIICMALVFLAGFSRCSTIPSEPEKEETPLCFSDPEVIKIQAEQAALNALANSIISTPEGQEERNVKITELNTKYPLFFAALNKELNLNNEIERGLIDENRIYLIKIDVACKKANLKRIQSETGQ